MGIKVVEQATDTEYVAPEDTVVETEAAPAPVGEIDAEPAAEPAEETADAG